MAFNTGVSFRNCSYCNHNKFTLSYLTTNAVILYPDQDAVKTFDFAVRRRYNSSIGIFL